MSGFLAALGPILTGAGSVLGAGAAIHGASTSAGSKREDRLHADERYRNELKATYGNSVKFSGERFTNPNIYGGKGSDLLGRDRDLEYSGKHLQQVFDVGAKQGLTPQEIAGSPAAGGTGRSGGNAVLGQSNAAAASNQAASYEAAANRASSEKIASMRANTDLAVAALQSGVNVLGQDKQAATQRRGQDVQTQVANIAAEAGKFNATQIANATKAAAAMSASAIKYSADRSLEATKFSSTTTRMTALDQLAQKRLVDKAQIESISAGTALALQDQRFKAIQHDERWARLFSTMGAENVTASALAVLNGIDIESVLKGVPADDATKVQLRNFIQHAMSKDSTFLREFVGGVETIKSINPFGGN